MNLPKSLQKKSHLQRKLTLIFTELDVTYTYFLTATTQLLKSSRNKGHLYDVTAAPFLVFFCSWQLRKRHQKLGSCDVIKVLLIS